MKIKILINTFFILIFFTSCEDYLDKKIGTDMYEDEVFHIYESAQSVARSVYTNLPNGLTYVWGTNNVYAMMAAATDEAEFTIQTHTIQKFNTGSWHATDMPDNPWSSYYEAIRKVHNFLAKADLVNYDIVKFDPSKQGVYEEQLEDIRQWKHEVLLLRAYFLFELIKRYGGVPIINEMLDADIDFNTVKRNTLQECVDEIIFWCDSTAKVLPPVQNDDKLGRLTSVAAKAIKSQVLLFAASDLWNDNSWAGTSDISDLISLPAGDRATRWKAAADATKEAIDLAEANGYTLDTHANLFGATNYRSPEVIFCKRAAATNTFEKTNLPISYDYVTGGNCPSQNLVDAFQVVVGGVASNFDWNNPDHAGNDPYWRRDPRLATFIVTNNSWFKERNVEAWTGGIDGAGVRNATPTGYYLKKYVQSGLDLTRNQTGVHSWILIRLSELYLNYIEALNEYAPGHADIKIYYDLIRDREGVAMPGLPTGLSPIETREEIRRERFVELCFEGQRWFDLRRWMQGEKLAEPLRAMEITKNGDNFIYKPYELEKRVFENKMYFYPISQTELNKLPEWKQNPLW